MAQEFFNYVKRDYENAPDWASVTKTIGNDLEKISKQRQDKRQAIEEASLAAVDALNQQEMGGNQTLNQMLLEGSNATKSHLLEMNKLMKQNKIKPEQYMNTMQAQLDDWSTLSGAVKGWNKDYDEYKDRVQEGTSAGMERSMAEWNEEFGNVSNKSIVVNPTNGRLYLTTKNPDGSINTDPEKMVTVNALNNRLKDRVDKYDLNEKVNTQVAQLGQIVNVINANGKMTIDDIRQNPEFITAEDKMVSALMGTPRNVSSILSDYVGGYSFTYDPAMKGKMGEDGKELILLKPDENGLYQPEFTEGQTAAARDHVKMQLEMQLGHKETPAAPVQRSSGRALTDGERNARAQKEEESYLYQTAVDIALGGEKGQSALDRVVRDTDVRNIVVDQSGNWVVQFDDPKRADETHRSSGDAETDALWLFNYTVGDNFIGKYGTTTAESARRAWSGVGGQSTSTPGQRQAIDPVSISEVTLDTGERLYDEIDSIFTEKTSLEKKVRDMNDVLSRMELPGGIDASEIEVSVINGSFYLQGLGLDPIEIPIGRNPAAAANILIDAVQVVVDEAVNKYNSGGAESQSGTKLTFPEWKKNNPEKGFNEYTTYYNS